MPANAEFAGLFSWLKRPTPQKTSLFSRASSRSGCGRACTSARPASRGLHHLVYEVVDNSVDEALAGRNDRIEVDAPPRPFGHRRRLGPRHPGRLMAEQGLPALTVVLTKLHAGGKFGGDGYKVSGGLHGVGVSVVNALSERLVAEVRRDGKVYRQEFERGVRTATWRSSATRDGRHRHDDLVPARRRDLRGARHRRRARSSQRLRETAFLTKGLTIKLTDERADGKTVEFHYEGGIRDFVSYINEEKDADPQAHRLLRGRDRPGRRRGRDAVEQLVPGVGLHVRQQHQHDRGRLAPLRLPQRAHVARSTARRRT